MEKTIRELREEMGLTVEELAQDMQVSTEHIQKLEDSGQTYTGYDREWGVPFSEPYGDTKPFWYPPEEAVEEWRQAIGILDGFMVAAEEMKSEPLVVILSDAITRARQELAGCRELLADFERQEEQIRSEELPLSDDG